MKSFARTDVGITRQMNQDFVYSSDTPVGPLNNLYIVADGMGGHNAGDFASRFSIEAFIDYLRGHPSTPSVVSTIEEAVRYTNEQLIYKASESPDYEGMGTTFVMASVGEDNVMKVANIGDSRLYLINSSIVQVTEDHSLVAEMVKNGDIKRDEARFHPKKNVVTRAISATCVVNADIYELAVSSSDTILLCSDGLSNMVSDNEILEIVNRHGDDLEAAVNELVDKANENGGKDNISVILFKVS